MREESQEKANLSHEEQLRNLYLDQKHTLDLFLERGAISQEQYDISLGELTKKLNITEIPPPD